MLLNNNAWTVCPFMDTPQCRGTQDQSHNKQRPGIALYWAPEDYANFTKAFLSNKDLTEAFLLPKYL